MKHYTTMKNLIITTFLIFFIGVSLHAQGDLEVTGKVKVGTMDLVTAGDSMVIWQADGTLGIREVLTAVGLSIDSVYTFDPDEVGGPLSLIIQYSDMTRDTLSGALTPGPKGDKGDDGVGIAQTLSVMGDSLSLSDGGGKVRIDTSNTNEKITGFGIIGDSLYIKEGSMDTMKVNLREYIQGIIDESGGSASSTESFLLNNAIKYGAKSLIES